MTLVERVLPNARVLVPDHLLQYARSHVASGIEVVTATPLSIYDLLARTDYVLATSGIEFTYEAIFSEVPLMFLPPFNASQLLQNQLHRSVNPKSITYDDVSSGNYDFSRIHELTTKVQFTGMKGIWDSQFAQASEYLGRLTNQERSDIFSEIRRQQSKMLSEIGVDGGETIARFCLTKLGHDK